MKFLPGFDVWEGSLEYDEAEFVKGGIAYLLPRLNSTLGTLHKDDLFDKHWREATSFMKIPYFVYSPYFSGYDNWNWLRQNLPAGIVTCAVDIEIARDGYSPEEYSRNVQYLLDNMRGVGMIPVIYTGGGYTGLLNPWPAGRYWWARYPYSMYPAETTHVTWEQLESMIDALAWYPNDPTKIPGECRLWQCSGDRLIVPGTSRTIDVNISNMTAEEFAVYWKLPAVQMPSTGVIDLTTRVNTLEATVNELTANVSAILNALEQTNINVSKNISGIAEINAKIAKVKETL